MVVVLFVACYSLKGCIERIESSWIPVYMTIREGFTCCWTDNETPLLWSSAGSAVKALTESLIGFRSLLCRDLASIGRSHRVTLPSRQWMTALLCLYYLCTRCQAYVALLCTLMVTGGHSDGHDARLVLFREVGRRLEHAECQVSMGAKSDSTIALHLSMRSAFSHSSPARRAPIPLLLQICRSLHPQRVVLREPNGYPWRWAGIEWRRRGLIRRIARGT